MVSPAALGLVSALALGMSACASGSAQPPPLPPIAQPESGGAGEGEPGDDAGGDGSFDAIFGRYRHAGGEAEVEARDAAVERVVQEIFFLGRGMARDKLLEAARIYPEIVLERRGETITLELGDAYRLTADLGGAEVPVVGTDGEELQLGFRRRGATLVQVAKGERGGTRRVFAVEPDGSLTVQTTIFAARLPEPVVFELHYRR